MGKERVTAFSDGVVAILITIMVLELKVPQGNDFGALAAQWPVFLAYLLSFLNIGLIWNNHHHMFHAVENVNGRVLWANLFLMFCLSLLPFATAWMGQSHYATSPTALYGMVMLALAFAWYVLVQALIACNGGKDSKLARAVGADRKTLISAGLNSVAVPLALFGFTWIAVLCYLAVGTIWFIPDRRIESLVAP
jgi:uncharacterized membrane protein